MLWVVFFGFVVAGAAAGGPLLLTPYIQAGDVRQARDLALVTGLEPNITSYAGYLTVDNHCGSNLFFWFFPSQNDWYHDPVSLWLNGGPGTTSLYGMLTENGPYSLSLDGKLGLREYSWNRNSSLLYIDSPVGTGYSFTVRDECYATDMTRVGRDVVIGLEQFFELFPDVSANPFYITGESYAGKYIPAIAHTIYKNNSRINLQGLAIGNGFTDPINQHNFADYVYQLGLIDSNLKSLVAEYQEAFTRYIEDQQYTEATALLNELIAYVGPITGVVDLYNFLYADGRPEPDYNTFMVSPEVREAIHVGNATWHGEELVYSYLYADIPKSYKAWLEELMEQYRVVVYYGQLDIACAYALAMDYITKLEWSGAEEYKTAPRHIWRVGDRVAGYSKTSGRFTEVLVRNAGHMVPTDQPEWALDLYHRFLFDQPF